MYSHYKNSYYMFPCNLHLLLKLHDLKKSIIMILTLKKFISNK